MYGTGTGMLAISTLKMTRAKYNKNPKLTREQWIGFFKQQTMQVALLMHALEEAFKKIKSLEEALEAKQKIEEEEEEYSEEEEEYSNRKTIMVMDSHVKGLNARLIETELGGLLFTGQYSWEKRAYNSSEWPEAKKPLQNLEAVLPKILKEQEYTDAILQASCNDIREVFKKLFNFVCVLRKYSFRHPPSPPLCPTLRTKI